jgi:hypothetical protein
MKNIKQSYLEQKGIEERRKEIVRSDYNNQNAYSETHEDALSHPDDETRALGKGTNSGGHQISVPDKTKSSTLINYSSMDTSAGGGAYDIYGRNGHSGRERLTRINLYNKDNAYGPNSVDTSANLAEGQYSMRD